MKGDKRKGFIAGYKKAGPTLRITINIAFLSLFVGIIYFLVQLMSAATKGGLQEAQTDRDDKHQEQIERIDEVREIRGSRQIKSSEPVSVHGSLQVSDTDKVDESEIKKKESIEEKRDQRAGPHEGRSAMTSAWITYAWEDNADEDVDFIVQELIKKGIDIKLGKWQLNAGDRLWEQIESYIADPEESDAWIFLATENALRSERCREELAYALNRALSTRGKSYPLIALVPSSVDHDLLPSSIKTRVYVSLGDPNWQERVVSAVQRRSPEIDRASVEPFVVKVHRGKAGDKRFLILDRPFVIEVRPRAGVWTPFLGAIPAAEKD